ncbi:hypothetical protein BRADI_4g17463v3 [Brachypodium distachyon]|uniref:Uncharacterized protein n=2 Tax=Brachypodium distachyon TaxID=15368 RepID=A0A0Q3PGE3_BRADI|nr:hypothetical protein BRADI_4g17463v3 [Brachypodium distachyon]
MAAASSSPVRLLPPCRSSASGSNAGQRSSGNSGRNVLGLVLSPCGHASMLGLAHRGDNADKIDVIPVGWGLRRFLQSFWRYSNSFAPVVPMATIANHGGRGNGGGGGGFTGFPAGRNGFERGGYSGSNQGDFDAPGGRAGDYSDFGYGGGRGGHGYDDGRGGYDDGHGTGYRAVEVAAAATIVGGVVAMMAAVSTLAEGIQTTTTVMAEVALATIASAGMSSAGVVVLADVAVVRPRAVVVAADRLLVQKDRRIDSSGGNDLLLICSGCLRGPGCGSCGGHYPPSDFDGDGRRGCSGFGRCFSCGSGDHSGVNICGSDVRCGCSCCSCRDGTSGCFVLVGWACCFFARCVGSGWW